VVKLSKSDLQKLNPIARSLAHRTGVPYPNWIHYKGLKLSWHLAEIVKDVNELEDSYDYLKNSMEE